MTEDRTTPEQPESGSPTAEPSDAPQEDFASMLEASLQEHPPQRRSLEVGESVEGVVVALSRDSAFVDIGGKGEASMSLEELTDDSGEVTVKVGDRVRALVVSTGPGVVISRRLAQGAAAREQLEAAFRAGLPVDGRVEKVNKGGYEIRISGQRAFCPMSQMELRRDLEPEEHVGKSYTFRITELKNGGRDVVLSRRALLEEEAREKAREVMARVKPGAVLQGTVATLTDFGAFVDLGGGVQGLLHVSEMGWSRVSSPADVVQAGQPITVQVIRVDEDGRRISLSLKPLQADPWLKVPEAYKVGQSRPGRVTRLAEFGAFVELEPGIEALAHRSTLVHEKGDWKDAVQPGTTATFRIESVDTARRRIGVSLSHAMPEAAGGDEGAAPKPEPAQPRGLGSLADQLQAALRKDDMKG